MANRLAIFFKQIANEPLNVDAMKIYETSYQRIAEKTDIIFAALFIFQWFLGIAFALFYSPLSWVGTSNSIHIHVYMALFLGGLLALYPAYMNLKYPGETKNRFVGAIAQIAFSALFIHLTGGRIETHFHIFGSLAFLAFYRDIRVLLLATVLTAFDHFLRGLFLPESVYGVLTSTPWRAVEHAAWVIFEDVFLFISIHLGIRELALVAKNQDQVEKTLANVERLVKERTAALTASQETILQQQKTIIATSKMSALGEMAGGVAHEVNNPIAIIKSLSSQMTELLEEKFSDYDALSDLSKEIEKSTDRIGKIITGLKAFSDISNVDSLEQTSAEEVVSQALAFCSQQITDSSIEVRVDFEKPIFIQARTTELIHAIVQILINSVEATKNSPSRWIQIKGQVFEDLVEISIEDSGKRISENIVSKIFQPFFTTKEVGQGTGLGLSIAQGIAKSHGGDLFLDSTNGVKRFVLQLPAVQLLAEKRAS